MKEEIIRVLRNAGEQYISGSDLCERFGVSRQAVWKNITALKECGYEIESIPNKGYRMLSSPDKLYAPEIISYLSEDSICKKVLSFDCVDSTNIKAKQLAELGETEGTLVVAEQQTTGKGRRGRSWQSEYGVGVWMTLILRPEIPPVNVSGLTLLTALAVARAIRQVCDVSAQIKWPNDIVIAKKKICGILTEMSSEENFVHYVAVGVGINANTKKFPPEIKNIASSIQLETGKKVDRCALTAAFVSIFSDYYRKYLKEQTLSSFIEEYNSILANADKEVRVYYGMAESATAENIDVGIAKGINKDGALLVEIDGKIKEIVSGEVSVRGLYGYV